MPEVAEVRCRGFMAGIDLGEHDPALRLGHRVTLEARKRGAIVRPLGDTVVLMPPLAISKAELTPPRRDHGRVDRGGVRERERRFGAGAAARGGASRRRAAPRGLGSTRRDTRPPAQAEQWAALRSASSGNKGGWASGAVDASFAASVYR